MNVNIYMREESERERDEKKEKIHREAVVLMCVLS